MKVKIYTREEILEAGPLRMVLIGAHSMLQLAMLLIENLWLLLLLWWYR